MIDGVKLIDISSIVDERGSLSFVECNKDIEFTINRVYWLYDFKSTRGGHAHKALKQLMVCMHGTIEIEIRDEKKYKTFILDNPNMGLYIFQPLWREVRSASQDSCLAVFASDIYDESDYIRSYEEFKAWKLNS